MKKRFIKGMSFFFILLLATMAVLTGCGGGGQPTATEAPTEVPAELTQAQEASVNAALADYLATSENDTLNAADRVEVSDLSVTPGLPADWLNILLLGSDSRNDAEASRTDTMIICSINQTSGKVKLTSIMRDTAITRDGKTYRINSANFYGGPNLAMKTVNECFGMNIENYVYVNFNGFAQIATQLGGIEVSITEQEMEQINKNVQEQLLLDVKTGIMTYEEGEKEYYDTLLTQFGDNIPLTGQQTLGYARIRKIDTDYARTERQRRVINILMAKMRGTDISTLMSLGASMIGYVTTNMKFEDMLTIANAVLNNDGFTNAEEMRLPKTGTYIEETRNNDAMLYDTDFEANKRELFNFIYE